MRNRFNSPRLSVAWFMVSSIIIASCASQDASTSSSTSSSEPISETSTAASETTTANQPTFDSVEARKYFDEAADHSSAHGGLSILIRHNGEVVYERYEQGTTADEPHNLFSGTKSFNCAVAVSASEDGLLDLDEAISDTLTQWVDNTDLKDITIRDLLTLSSGIEGGEKADIVSYEDAVEHARVKDRSSQLFDYGPNPFQIFGALMNAKLSDNGEDVLDYLTRRVFDPIGLEYATLGVVSLQINRGSPQGRF